MGQISKIFASIHVIVPLWETQFFFFVNFVTIWETFKLGKRYPYGSHIPVTYFCLAPRVKIPKAEFFHLQYFFICNILKCSHFLYRLVRMHCRIRKSRWFRWFQNETSWRQITRHWDVRERSFHSHPHFKRNRKF